MAASPLKNDLLTFYLIDKQPTGLNMAFQTVSIIASEFVTPKSGGQVFAVSQDPHHFVKLGQLLSSAAKFFNLSLEAIRNNGLIHWKNSALH